MQHVSARSAARTTSAILVGTVTILLAITLFLGAVVLGATILILAQDSTLLLQGPWVVSDTLSLQPWLGAAGVIAGAWALFTAASVAVRVLRARDALTWGTVALVASLCVFALTGQLLVGLAGLMAAMLALAGVGPIRGALGAPASAARTSHLSVVETRPVPPSWALDTIAPALPERRPEPPSRP
ncbi:MAG TPA: hypothetical protein VGR28_06605 [Candidatus Thermoplasmatota archaeon]|jgi:hypothetical protein|nr:hypothetical protein [Candidatus Thermoplasmatota archaeon]